jgi:excisionase family DNA binding protein
MPNRATISEPTTWLTVAEVAHHCRLTERGVRQMIADGRLPASKVGRNVLRVRRADLDRLFEPLPTVEGGAA